jgi:hypothetical protein
VIRKHASHLTCSIDRTYEVLLLKKKNFQKIIDYRLEIIYFHSMITNTLLNNLLISVVITSGIIIPA